MSDIHIHNKHNEASLICTHTHLLLLEFPSCQVFYHIRHLSTMESGHLKENDLFLTHPPGNMKRKKARQKGSPDTQEGEITTSELLKI